MSSTKCLQYTTTINAPVPTVWRAMIGRGSYERWTSAFSEGSTFEGSWEQGTKIRFLGPSGDGMLSEVAESRPHEFIPDEWEEHMSAAWPKALELLKQISEADGAV